jgi:4-methyl-5(b-hydroxyethyl)-thiazole monophosphate biosynthesis
MDKREKTAIVFMADGMEMCECLLTADILRRAGIRVITASVKENRTVTASHQVQIESDVLAAEADYEKADILILPGGRVGTENLAASEIALKQCAKFAADSNKCVAAVCAAPSVLSGLGLLDGRRATCHPDFAEKVQAGSSINDGLADTAPLVELTHESVTVDGNIITGQRSPPHLYIII